MKLRKLKKVIDYLVELNDEKVLDDEFNVGHDEIYLPIPKCKPGINVSEDLKELGFFIDKEEDCVKGFV